MQRLAEFAAWLPKHAGLVVKIHFSPLFENEGDLPVAGNLLSSAMQRCNVAMGNEADAQAQRRPSPVLQLQEYHTRRMIDPVALHALAVSPRLRNITLIGSC